MSPADVPISAADQFARAAGVSVTSLRALTAADWSVPASTLAWSCWQTVDHTVDCIFSYALQLAARRRGDWLPVGELHVRDGASPDDLVESLEAVGRIFAAVLASAPPPTEASDGVVLLEVDDWAARGAYEILLHTHDVCVGLAAVFDPPPALCSWMLGSSALWMFDRQRAVPGRSPWEQALLGSGRQPPSGGAETVSLLP